MKADVRMDRMARPQWNALSEGIRSEIEFAIPDGCYLTVLSTHWNGHDFHARVFRGTELVAESLPCRYVEVACWMALRRARMEAPIEATYERDGYVVEPLSYENREGDPAFNGAFDRW